MKPLYYLLILALLFGGTSVGCGDKSHTTPPVIEEPDDETPGKDPGEDPEEPTDAYPKGLTVAEFTDQLGGDVCKGFVATVDFKTNPDLAFRPQLSSAKKPTAYFSAFTDGTPYVAVNGGYFSGGTSVSLLVDNSRLRSNNAPEETISGKTYPLARAALGQMSDGSFEAVWAANVGADLYAFPSAVANDDSAGTVGTAFTASTAGARKWTPKYAIGGGPMLVYDGENVAAENTPKELLTYIAGRNPRTALGVTEDGKLIVLVCDGRNKNNSAGYTFVELADKMIALGCTYAVNLDGGGSSVFVGREGTVMNAPSDGVQRSVPTAVIISQNK